MPNWKGNITEKKYRKHAIIENIEEHSMMLSTLQVRSIESKSVDHVFDRSTSYDYNPGTCYLPIPKQAGEVGIILVSVDPLCISF